jgi:hypothetical protein
MKDTTPYLSSNSPHELALAVIPESISADGSLTRNLPFTCKIWANSPSAGSCNVHMQPRLLHEDSLLFGPSGQQLCSTSGYSTLLSDRAASTASALSCTMQSCVTTGETSTAWTQPSCTNRPTVIFGMSQARTAVDREWLLLTFPAMACRASLETGPSEII